jgi:hypothetical protein
MTAPSARKSGTGSLLLMALLLTYFGTVIYELFLAFVFVAGNRHSSDSFTGAWIWYIAFIYFSVRFLRHLRIRGERIGEFCLFALFVCGISLSLLPHKYQPLPTRYAGVEASFGREVGEFNFDDSVGLPFLFKADDPRLLRRLAQNSPPEKNLNVHKFIFWQTGVAKGYRGYLLPEYPSSSGFIYGLELFFTVGPLSLCEMLIRALAFHLLPFLLVVATYHAFYIVRKGEKLSAILNTLQDP